MKYLSILILLFSQSVFAKKTLCSDKEDFSCLAEKPVELYIQDFELWWEMYNQAVAPALKCSSPEDVANFLQLWSGQTDGEMTQALIEDTETIIINDVHCFFAGLRISSIKSQTALISRFCPVYKEKKVKKRIKQYANNVKPNQLVSKLEERMQSEKCLFED